MLGAGRQEETGWPFVSDTHSPENGVTLGASWSACVQCAVEGHPAVLASADRARGSAVSAEREPVDSNTCKSTRLFQARLYPGTQKVLSNLSLSECLFHSPLPWLPSCSSRSGLWKLQAHRDGAVKEFRVRALEQDCNWSPHSVTF